MSVAVPSTSEAMKVNSDLLGPITITEEEILHFPGGLYGLPECQSFALLTAERDGLFWLQSIDHSALSFLLADPFRFCEGYAVELSAAEVTELGAHTADDVAILAIVTLPRVREERPTANLQGPLAINLSQRTAKQLAISELEYGVRTPINLPSAE